MATTKALDLAQSASTHARWVPGEQRGPQSSLQRPSPAPCRSTSERHCHLNWAPGAAARYRKSGGTTKWRHGLIDAVSKKGTLRVQIRVRAGRIEEESRFMQWQACDDRETIRATTSEADTSASNTPTEHSEEAQCGSSFNQNSFPFSRRQVGLLALPLALISASKARAEEADSQSAPPVASQNSSSIADSNASETLKANDGLLEGENIKVSGGTSKTGRLEVGPDYRRYRAEDFSIYVPRSYENVTEVDVSQNACCHI